MSKKIVSLLLAVMMIAALCTVAFVATSAAEDEMLKVTYADKTYNVKVGDTITFKKSVVLPEGYAVQGGKYQVKFDTAFLEAQYDEEAENYATTDLNIDPTSDMMADGSGIAAAYAATKYSKKNVLAADSDNFATFTFKAVKAGETTVTDAGTFDIGLFQEDAPTTIIPVIKADAAADGQDALAAQITFSTVVTAPTYEDPSESEPSESEPSESEPSGESKPSDKPTETPTKPATPASGEAATTVFVLLAVVAMAAGVVFVARKRASK